MCIYFFFTIYISRILFYSVLLIYINCFRINFSIFEIYYL